MCSGQRPESILCTAESPWKALEITTSGASVRSSNRLAANASASPMVRQVVVSDAAQFLRAWKVGVSGGRVEQRVASGPQECVSCQPRKRSVGSGSICLGPDDQQETSTLVKVKRASDQQPQRDRHVRQRKDCGRAAVAIDAGQCPVAAIYQERHDVGRHPDQRRDDGYRNAVGRLAVAAITAVGVAEVRDVAGNGASVASR